jgi:CheY-like chemotaxis protein
MKLHKNIAVIDDDDIYVLLTKRIIEKTHLFEKVIVFKNGLEGLNFIKENFNDFNLLPEIILLDLSMPIMNGWQFLDEFMKLYPKNESSIKIYISTSSISPNDVERAKKISIVSNYLIKPISKEVFIKMLNDL